MNENHTSTRRIPTGQASKWRLDTVVAELRLSRDLKHNIHGPVRLPPSRVAIETILSGLIQAIFPRHYGASDIDSEAIDYFVGNALNTSLNSLSEQIQRSAIFISDDLDNDRHVEDAIDITRNFASKLPEIRGFWSAIFRPRLSAIRRRRVSRRF